MARPQKETVDYFSHDANASESRTLSILYNNFGHEGISCWWQLLERVSSTRNHVISLRNGEDLEYLAAKLRLKSDRLQAILTKMAEIDAIDKDLFERGLVFSQNFLDRVAPVYKTRHQNTPKKPEFIIVETGLSVEQTGLLPPHNTQTKLKETKLKKKESKERKLTPEREGLEFDEYVETMKVEYPELDIDKELKKFTLYWSEGNRKLRRPKSAFGNWLEKALEFKKEKEAKNGTHKTGDNKTGAAGGDNEEDGAKYISGKYGSHVRH